MPTFHQCSSCNIKMLSTVDLCEQCRAVAYWARSEVRKATNTAIRRGELKPRDTCQRCKKRWAAHCHHLDYSNPLDVEWLCKRCHTDIHTEQRKTGRLFAGNRVPR